MMSKRRRSHSTTPGTSILLVNETDGLVATSVGSHMSATPIGFGGVASRQIEGLQTVDDQDDVGTALLKMNGSFVGKEKKVMRAGDGQSKSRLLHRYSGWICRPEVAIAGIMSVAKVWRDLVFETVSLRQSEVRLAVWGLLLTFPSLKGQDMRSRKLKR